MTRNVIISKLNPLWFYEVNNPTSFNHKIWDYASFKEQQYYWMQNEEYLQPVQNNDSLSLQIWTSNNISTAPVMRMYSCSGELIRTDNLVYLSNYANSFVWFFVDNDYYEGIESGEYYISITFTWGSSQRLFLCNPITLEQYHENTMLLQTSATENNLAEFFMFGDTSQVINRRFYGALINQQQGSDRTVFNEQNGNLVTLYDSPYKTWILQLGGDTDWIPDYEIEAISHCLSCEINKVDGLRIVKNDGSNFEKEENRNGSLFNANIEVRESDTQQGAFRNSGLFIIMSPIPAYPFLIWNTSINGINMPMDRDYIGSLSDLNDYLSLLEERAETAGFTGLFYVDGTDIVYDIGTGESVFDAKIEVLTSKFSFSMNNSGIGDYVTQFQMAGVSSKYAFVKSGTIVESGYRSALTTSNFTDTAPSTPTYILFHDDTITQINVIATYLSSIGGTYSDSPIQLRTFFVIGGLITSFNLWDRLKRSRNNLLDVTIRNTNLATLGAYYNAGDGLPVWKYLNKISFFQNKLTSTTIDNFVNGIYALGDIIPDGGFVGYMRFNGNTPSAPPTGASATARAWLTYTMEYLTYFDS